jgi:hypothetical protein
MDDALAKLQEIIDRAVEAVTPKEADPETIARVKRKCGGARGGRLGRGQRRAGTAGGAGAGTVTPKEADRETVSRVKRK